MFELSPWIILNALAMYSPLKAFKKDINTSQEHIAVY